MPPRMNLEKAHLASVPCRIRVAATLAADDTEHVIDGELGEDARNQRTPSLDRITHRHRSRLHDVPHRLHCGGGHFGLSVCGGEPGNDDARWGSQRQWHLFTVFMHPTQCRAIPGTE